MQDKKEIAKLILAGLLVTASLPTDVQAEHFSGNEMYLAVAGCGDSNCSGKGKGTGLSTEDADEVADAGKKVSTPSTAHEHSNKTDAHHKAQKDAAKKTNSPHVNTHS